MVALLYTPPRMSNLKKAINFKALESELDDALRADKLYKLQNDAKFRAIEQRVPTYDHFSDMVKAAHLKPLERAEMQKKAEVSWNHCYQCREDELYAKSWLETGDDNTFESAPEPKTSADFLKAWSRLPRSEDKFEFLHQFRNRLKDKFFRTEIPVDFLEQFFRVSYEVCSKDNVLLIVHFLQTFAECNRFSLILAMISSKEYPQLLFEKLLTLLRDDANIRGVKILAQTYGLILKPPLK